MIDTIDKSMSLTEQAIQGWKESTNELMPLFCYVSFLYGSNKEFRDSIKQLPDNPIQKIIDKGASIVKSLQDKNCLECNTLNDHSSNFCKECGKKLIEN